MSVKFRKVFSTFLGLYSGGLPSLVTLQGTCESTVFVLEQSRFLLQNQGRQAFGARNGGKPREKNEVVEWSERAHTLKIFVVTADRGDKNCP